MKFNIIVNNLKILLELSNEHKRSSESEKVNFSINPRDKSLNQVTFTEVFVIFLISLSDYMILAVKAKEGLAGSEYGAFMYLSRDFPPKCQL